MDTKKYEVFAKTVEMASLTRAAQELGLTQSGVSHIIAAVESELELPLLKRTRTGARLTPEGERVMPYIQVCGAGYYDALIQPYREKGEAQTPEKDEEV